MKTINGTGTILYGRSAKRMIQPAKRRLEVEASGFAPYSYQATKWFVFFFLPVVPLGSFRVIPSDQGFFSTEQSEYLLAPAPWNVIQVIGTYVIGWGSLFLAKWLVWDLLLS